MKISLRTVTAENWRQVSRLQVRADQVEYVAWNQHSLLEAAFGFAGELAHLTLVPLAVYAGEEPVGFLMYNTNPEQDRFFIMRLMMDREKQGMGFGGTALEQLIARFKTYPGVKEAAVSYIPANSAAAALYRRLGFEEVGLDEDGREMIAVLNLGSQGVMRESLWDRRAETKD